MNETESVLLLHFRRYPLMLPQDAVKLLCQGEFGGGHLISDPSSALRRLICECETVQCAPFAEAVEGIGSGLARVYLPALPSLGLSAGALCDVFCRSAELVHGSLASLCAKLSILEELADTGKTPFSARGLSAFLGEYKSSGFPLLSHSDEYRAAYKPAYRVVLRRLFPQ